MPLLYKKPGALPGHLLYGYIGRRLGIVIFFFLAAKAMLGLVPEYVDDSKCQCQQNAQYPGEVPHYQSPFTGILC